MPDENQAATERETAPETATFTAPPVEQAWTPPPPPAPRQKRIERQGGRSEPFVKHYPDVRGGVCEFCGVLDPNVPSQFQYKLCQHYRGMQLQCSYCSADKDPDDIIYRSKLGIMDNPDRPDELIVVCNSYDCERAHQRRFQLNAS